MLNVTFGHCAGLDVHKKTVVATRIRPLGESEEAEAETQTFGTTTAELLALMDWLLAWEVTHVAMESTGVYWQPIHNILEGNLEVWLVNAHHLKQVPGRKTDVGDSAWLAQVMRLGLVKPSFIPPQPQRDLRDLTRYRVKLVQERAREVNRIQKVLEGANIKLASVASDVLGVSGRAMLEALAAGEADAKRLAELAKGRLRQKLPQLEQALAGRMRAHQAYLLTHQLAHLDFLDEEIAGLSEQIERHLAALPPVVTPPAAPGGATSLEERSAPTIPLPPLTAAAALLDTIPGVSLRLAQAMLAEVGLDLTRFPSAKHLAAWAGVAPGNHESGGKRHSGRTRQGNPTLRTLLVEGAWAAAKTKQTYLAALYHRLAGRRGKKRAVVAVAHAMLVSAYYMLTRRTPYLELGPAYLDHRKKELLVNRLLQRLNRAGYAVTLQPMPAPA
jgi:transposase